MTSYASRLGEMRPPDAEIRNVYGLGHYLGGKKETARARLVFLVFVIYSYVISLMIEEELSSLNRVRLHAVIIQFHVLHNTAIKLRSLCH